MTRISISKSLTKSSASGPIAKTVKDGSTRATHVTKEFSLYYTLNFLFSAKSLSDDKLRRMDTL
jgi:hypothetical protein